MFETESKFSNDLVVLLICGPKKGILNKIGWLVVTLGTITAGTVEYWTKFCKEKFQKLGV